MDSISRQNLNQEIHNYDIPERRIVQRLLSTASNLPHGDVWEVAAIPVIVYAGMLHNFVLVDRSTVVTVSSPNISVGLK
jgi:hypothetical protein